MNVHTTLEAVAQTIQMFQHEAVWEITLPENQTIETRQFLDNLQGGGLSYGDASNGVNRVFYSL